LRLGIFAAAIRIVTLWHFSRLSVGLAAGVMTVTSSRVLVGGYDRSTVLFVGLGALAGYWFDDLVDLVRDETKHPGLRTVRGLRLALLTAGLLIVVAGAILEIGRQHVSMFMLAGVMCVATLLYCLRYAIGAGPVLNPLGNWIKALVWSAACVLLPQVARDITTTPQTWMAFGFFVLLMVPVADMWKYPMARPAGVVRLLAGQCVVAALLVLIGVGFGWFPWYNLALLTAPAANLLFLWIRQQQLIRRAAVFTELAVIFNVLCAWLVVGAYTSGMRIEQAIPDTLADWVQLGGLAAVAILIGGNHWLRRMEGQNPVRNEAASAAVITLGLSISPFSRYRRRFIYRVGFCHG